MKNIASIGWKLQSDKITSIPLISNNKKSLADYDIVLLELSVLQNVGLSLAKSHKPHSLSGVNYSLICHSAKHWKAELKDFVSNGGVLIVNLCEAEYYEFSNTHQNYEHFLDVKVKFQELEGKRINLKSPLYKDIFQEFKTKMSYHVVASPTQEDIFYTNTNKKVVGCRETLNSKGGYILYLPYIKMERSDKTSIDRLLQLIIALDANYKGVEEKSIIPDWLNLSDAYNIKSADLLKSTIKSNDDKIKYLIEENKDINKEVAEQEILQGLLFETGKPLEKATIKAFQLLGCNAENYDDGKLELDLLIQTPEGITFIGECEGRDNKPIALTKFRQILDSLREYIYPHNIDDEEIELREAYGILIGNPYRLEDPKSRNNELFTKHCIARAEKENISLLSTVDLFYVTRYIQESNDLDFAQQCRNTIINNVGSIIKFPELPNSI